MTEQENVSQIEENEDGLSIQKIHYKSPEHRNKQVDRYNAVKNSDENPNTRWKVELTITED